LYGNVQERKFLQNHANPLSSLSGDLPGPFADRFCFSDVTPRRAKAARRGGGYLLHGLIHYFSAVIITGFVLRGSMLLPRTHLVILGLTLVHLLLDLAKMQLARRHPACDGSLAYISDQLLHFLTVGLAAWLLTPAVPFGELSAFIQNSRAVPNKFLAVPVIYVGVVFGGGYLIRFLVRFLATGVKSHSQESISEQLQNAGLYIGWLERFLVVTALLLQSPATVGLILTAKIHRPLSRIQIRALCGIFPDRHAPEHLDRSRRRRATGKAPFRPGALLGIRHAALSSREPSPAASPLLKSSHGLIPGFSAPGVHPTSSD